MSSPSPRTRKAVAASGRAAVSAAAPATPASAATATSPALLGALATLLEPLASLAVTRGVPFAALEDLLKAAFVEAARRAQPESAGLRIVSRVATATGLTRREVTRLLLTEGGPPPARPSPATEVFTRWLADPALRDRRGRPLTIPRQGPAPSFEALARSVTQDVHPRSLLEELGRLGLVALDGAGSDDERVRLLRDSVVATGDSERAYGFLGTNVGDHLRAGVENVLAETPPHVEQAVFADELSEASMIVFRDLAKAQWKLLLDATVPALQALVDGDAAAGRPRDRRVRIGLYTYHNRMQDAPTAAAGTVASSPKRTAKKDRR